jgi:hypothetical protein
MKKEDETRQERFLGTFFTCLIILVVGLVTLSFIG